MPIVHAVVWIIDDEPRCGIGRFGKQHARVKRRTENSPEAPVVQFGGIDGRLGVKAMTAVASNS